MKDYSKLPAAFAAALFLAFSGTAAGRQLDERTREEVTAAAATAIAEHFYDASRGREIAAALREHAESGGFASANTTDRYTQALGAFLSEYDAHFRAGWRPPDAEIGSRPAMARDGAADNYGFKRVEILPGNVGYIRLDRFHPAAEGGEAALAALEFVANTDAVIFDVRANGGGAASMVQFLISHFLAAGGDTLINTFVSSTRDYPRDLAQLDWVPGPRRPDVPLYVLTSARSASAAEAFPYHLKAMKRATIVGERTAGAGNPGRPFDVGHGFNLFVATGSARNPITGTNWEGEGVLPDVVADSERALDAARDHAYAILLEDGGLDEKRREMVRYAREALAMGERLDDGAAHAELAGDYGPFTITADETGLILRNGRRPAHALIPADTDRFFVEDMPDLRLLVERTRGGEVEAIALDRAGSRPMRFDRAD